MPDFASSKMLEPISRPFKTGPGATEGAPGFTNARSDFQNLYERTPLRAIKLFFHYVSAQGADQIARQMAFWATNGTLYISVLLEEPLGKESLSSEIAATSIYLMPELDPQFLIKLARAAASLEDSAAVLRALHLVPALRDYSILIPWLRTLEKHPESRIRSRSAKLICQLRPSDGLIQHHLQSRDPRVRASVMEALWDPKVKQLDQKVLAHLRSGITDSNHRVVANALVGLYRLGDTAALEKMIALCSTKSHLLRAAMAWAMGAVYDSRAIPSLLKLLSDPSFIVRKCARESLLALDYEPEDPPTTQTSWPMIASGT